MTLKHCSIAARSLAGEYDSLVQESPATESQFRIVSMHLEEGSYCSPDVFLLVLTD